MKRRAALTAALCLLLSRRLRAADLVRLIVAYPPGGAADVVARRLQERMRLVPSQPLVVENLPGAGGGLAVQRLLAGPADGSQWLVGTISEAIVAPLLNPTLGYQPEQLRLVGIAAGAAMVLVGRAATDPQASLVSLLEAARRPGAAALAVGNFGHGSISHLMAEDLALRTAAPVLHVPHAGMAPLLRELIAGRVELAFVPMAASVAEWVQQGRLRLHAVAALQRDPKFPAVPTLDEALGTNGFRQQLWVGIFLPAGVPETSWDRAAAALAAAQTDPDFQRIQRSESSEPGVPMGAAQARALHAADIAHYRRLVGVIAPSR
jgi:tripartite-type tricarboxylate transporter receptor subunit TctC